ncbi:MAG: hypothetical protein ABSH20_12290 [Tepidisphaeraceae bacterium]|jgi:hypothetical protein
MTAFQIVQSIYWLALTIWFGGLVFIAVAWPVIFTVVKEEDPTLPRVLSVNVDHDHAGLLAGTIVGSLIRHIGFIQLCCAAVVLLMLVCQWFVISESWHNRLSGIARCSFFVGSAIMLVVDRYVVWPKAWKAREDFIENADDPDKANVICERFIRHQRESVRLMLYQLVLLSLVVVFSSAITPRWY